MTEAERTAMTDRRIRSAEDLADLDFDKADGLIPVVAQDAASGAVLMVAWANRDALALTLETGFAHFWSRSRGELWKKGETSGNVLAVRSIHADCDADTVLVLVEPTGPACHTGEPTCFGEGATVDVAAASETAASKTTDALVRLRSSTHCYNITVRTMRCGSWATWLKGSAM